MRPRKLDPEAAAILARRQAALTALTTHPSWPELEAEVERKKARIWKLLQARFLGGSAPVNQREVDYYRGLMDGFEWLVRVPRDAELSLEKYLQRRGVTLPEEEHVSE